MRLILIPVIIFSASAANAADDLCYQTQTCNLPLDFSLPGIPGGTMVKDPKPREIMLTPAGGPYTDVSWIPGENSYKKTGIQNVRWHQDGPRAKVPPPGVADQTQAAIGRWKTPGDPCAIFQVYYNPDQGYVNPPTQNAPVRSGEPKLTEKCTGGGL